MRLTLLPGRYAICRLAADAPLPAWFRPGPLASATWTADELSLIAPVADVPPEVTAERGWRAFKVMGPLDFSLTGVLAGLTAPLAEAGISVFALSTYDTDYLLVRADAVEAARAALAARFEVMGEEVVQPSSSESANGKRR